MRDLYALQERDNGFQRFIVICVMQVMPKSRFDFPIAQKS